MSAVWKYTDASLRVVSRTNPDGSLDSRLASDPEVQAAGTPDPADPVAPLLTDLLAPTDVAMARLCEDLIVLLIAKGVIAKSDIAPAGLAKINARRALRNQSAL